MNLSTLFFIHLLNFFNHFFPMHVLQNPFISQPDRWGNFLFSLFFLCMNNAFRVSYMRKKKKVKKVNSLVSKTTIFFIAFHFSNHFNSLWLLKFRKLKKKINVQTNIAGADAAKLRVPNVFSHGFGVLRSWRKTGAQPWR